MTIEELKKKQEELDKEKLACPKCGGDTIWGILRELGTCLECYLQYDNRGQYKTGIKKIS